MDNVNSLSVGVEKSGYAQDSKCKSLRDTPEQGLSSAVGRNHRSRAKRSFLERMPQNVMGGIVRFFPEFIGNRLVSTDTDIDVAKYTFRDLGQTSRAMFALVHSEEVTKTFIRAVSKHHEIHPMAMAVKLNTPLAMQFLWKEIHKQGLEKDFHAMRDILKMPIEIASEAKELGLFVGKMSSIDNDIPSASESRLVQGITLGVERRGLFLFSRFGIVEVSLPAGRFRADKISQHVFIEALIKRVNACFIRCTDWCPIIEYNDPKPESKMPRGLKRADQRKMCSDEAEDKKGLCQLLVPEDSFAVCQHEVKSFRAHQIGAAGDEERVSELQAKSLNRAWTMLVNHEKRQNFLSVEKEYRDSSLASFRKEFLVESMKDIQKMFINHYSALEAELEVVDRNYRCASDLNYDVREFYRTLMSSINDYLRPDEWFAIEPMYICDEVKICKTKRKDNVSRFIKPTLEKLIEDFQVGWIRTPVHQALNVVGNHSEEYSDLYVNEEKTKFNHSELHNSMKAILGFDDSQVVFSKDWKKPDGSIATRSRSYYVWVKRSHRNEVVRKMGLQLAEAPGEYGPMDVFPSRRATAEVVETGALVGGKK